MIKYNQLKKLFYGRDIEYIKSTLGIIFSAGKNAMSKGLRHKLLTILRYYTIKDKISQLISRKKRTRDKYEGG
jgi:hypothetical protein